LVVTTVRKITEVSFDDCHSMKSCYSDAGIKPTESEGTFPLPVDLEENAIFEHESSLYGGDVLNDRSGLPRSSDSGTMDDDDLVSTS
jgi:hypothetical protein